jgi:hypothetical protein
VALDNPDSSGFIPDLNVVAIDVLLGHLKRAGIFVSLDKPL